MSGVLVGLKRAQARVLRDWGLIGGDFSTLGGGVATFRQIAGGKILRLYWRFGGERFFLDVSRAGGDVGIV